MDDLSFVIRSATLQDLDWFCNVAPLFGIGITTLQNDKAFLAKRLELVEKSFAEQIPIVDRIYLFVVEVLAQKKCVGISGIDVSIGHKEIFYNYQISHVTQANTELDIFVDHRLLTLVNQFQHASELISLWVDPDYRRQSISRSLSWARLLFIAQFKEQFGTEILAEMRGISDSAGNSPFWEAVGQKFFNMDFATADKLCLTKNKQFIADLVARMPIYVDLLPQEARAVIGVEHPDTTPAKKLLAAQGFSFSNHIDIFDAGPVFTATVQDIPIVRDSRIATINIFDVNPDLAAKAFLYNMQLKARITLAKIQLTADDTIIISRNVADILQVKAGDKLRYYLI